MLKPQIAVSKLRRINSAASYIEYQDVVKGDRQVYNRALKAQRRYRVSYSSGGRWFGLQGHRQYLMHLPTLRAQSALGEELYDVEAMYHLRILRKVVSSRIPQKAAENASVGIDSVWRLAFGLTSEDVTIDHPWKCDLESLSYAVYRCICHASRHESASDSGC